MKIEDYGLIGDMHTAALVGKNGSIDWLCVPRFDADACFAAILGTEENGCWKIQPADSTWTSRQSYRDETLLLETEFETNTGVVRLIDCMPVQKEPRQLIRVVEGKRGQVKMTMKLVIRFDNGVTIPWVRHEDDTVRAVAGPNALVLSGNVPTHGEDLSTVADFTVKPGEQKKIILTWYPSYDGGLRPVDDADALIAKTEDFWRKWSARCKYKGEFRNEVIRSLITLKALTFAPTGGIIAAPTMSLPECIGGVRNWDYRFCWLRDATLTLYSFMEAGYTEEAAAWVDWLLRAVAGDPGQLQIMYGVAGERTLTELEVRHLPGYENSRPVRKGNAAAEQLQLDVYGEIMDAMWQARRLGISLDRDSWHLQRHFVDFVAKNWTLPDEGIWETRGPRRHFTHSKVMAWVAVDRAIKSVEQFGLDGDVEAWRQLRAAIHGDVCTKGYSEERGIFTQYYGATCLDASLLMMPLVGFLPAADPRIVRTISAIEKELMVDGLILRYHPANSQHVDGLPPGEGAFLPCSFWLVDCFCLLGRMEEAEAFFERLLALGNSLGLLAEEYDVKLRRQVGNFPQAFSHVGLINSALNLTKAYGPADKRLDTSSATNRGSALSVP